MEYNNISIVLISLVFSAMFSGIEIAFVSSDKLYLELLGQQGTAVGRILARFSKRPSRFIATTLVGNTVALVIYGIFMAAILEPVLQRTLPQQINNEVVILLTQSLRFLELVIESGASSGSFWILTLLALPRFFEIIGPLSLMAATIFVYNRWSYDTFKVIHTTLFNGKCYCHIY